MNVNEGPAFVKSEPNWTSYRSSFDGVHQSCPLVENGMFDQGADSGHMYQQQSAVAVSGNGQGSSVTSPPKRKGRQKKVKSEPGPAAGISVKQEQITDTAKVKKKWDRFKGTTEEEVLQRVLPDHIEPDLDILIIGINPGLTAAYVGHHYAGPGNHFWKCLFLSGLIPTQMNAYDDYKLKEYGIGFTNIVARTTRGSADLSKKEIKEGGEILTEKVKKYKPKIAVFNGKGIYEVFVGHKKFHIGKQPDPFPGCEGTAVFVMPSSSARFTQLPRAIDKVPFYLALKKYRDHLNGKIPELREEEVYFPELNLKVVPKAERLAEIARQEAESGQLLVKPEDKVDLQEGEAKPKRGRKKKSSPVAEAAAGETSVVNEPGVVVKSESGVERGGPTEDPSVEEMLAGGGTLVKQEDDSELAKFGIYSHQLQTMSALPGMPSASATTHYWPAQPYSTAGHGLCRAGMTYSQPPQHYSQSLMTGYHPTGNGMVPLTTAYNTPVIDTSVTSGYHNPSNSMPPVTSGHHHPGMLPVRAHHGDGSQASTTQPHSVQGGAGQSTVGKPLNLGVGKRGTESFSQFSVRPSVSSVETTSPPQSTETSTLSNPSHTGTSVQPQYTLVKEEVTPHTTPSHPYWNQVSKYR